MPGLVAGLKRARVCCLSILPSRSRPPCMLAGLLLAGAEGGWLPLVGAAHQPLAGAVRRDAHRPLPRVCRRARLGRQLAASPNLPGLLLSCAQTIALLAVPVAQQHPFGTCVCVCVCVGQEHVWGMRTEHT